MDDLKAALLDELHKVEGLESRPSPVAGGTALFYRGKEFAHFHHDHELDLRLTSKTIKSLGLSHPSGSIHHPGRSPNSAWIEVRFNRESDLQKVVELVGIAIAQL